MTLLFSAFVTSICSFILYSAGKAKTSSSSRRCFENRRRKDGSRVLGVTLVAFSACKGGDATMSLLWNCSLWRILPTLLDVLGPSVSIRSLCLLFLGAGGQEKLEAWTDGEDDLGCSCHLTLALTFIRLTSFTASQTTSTLSLPQHPVFIGNQSIGSAVALSLNNLRCGRSWCSSFAFVLVIHGSIFNRFQPFPFSKTHRPGILFSDVKATNSTFVSSIALSSDPAGSISWQYSTIVSFDVRMSFRICAKRLIVSSEVNLTCTRKLLVAAVSMAVENLGDRHSTGSGRGSLFMADLCR